jgi:formylglycine-generating enzyme
MKFWSGLTAIVACLVLGSTASATIITMVTVGDADNQADSSGYGAVSYTYNIGKYEVTAGQYAEFLNAVATTDTHLLYHANMANTSYGSGITRSGSSGSFTYAVDQAFVDRPVNYVSWYDAARFTNWLTSGNTESGVYNTTTWAADREAVSGTAYYIPTEDEWYKAAYYKGGATNAAYWLYPTQSDNPPGRDLNDDSGNNANYYGTPYPIQSPYYATVVGQFQNSGSPYGTFDQGGNVWEWNEALISSSRGLRGGSFNGGSGYLASSYRNNGPPTFEYYGLGFRVASSAAVPEPGSLIIWACGGLGALLLRRRRK